MSAHHVLEQAPRDRTFGGPVQVVRDRPLIAFFVLAFALSWWPALLYLTVGSAPPILGCGPFLAAVVVLGLTSGKRGVKALFRSMLKWRVGARWWAIAILTPVVLTIIATGLNLALGAATPDTADLEKWTSVIPALLLILLVPGLGGAWEEPGWRGYSLPRLLGRHSALKASLMLGALWALWHLPLFLTGEQHWSDLLLVVAASVVVTWLFRNVLGSVLVTMVFHATNNAFSGSYVSQMFHGSDSVRQSWMLAIVWGAAAILVALFAKSFRTSP